MKRVTIYLCITTLLLLATTLAGLGLAQSKPAQTAAPPPSGLLITEMMVKSAAGGVEFEHLLKTTLLPAMKKGGVQQFSVWKTAVFGYGEKYFLISPLQNLAAYDNPAPYWKGLGAEGALALLAAASQLVETSQTYSIVEQPNLSIAPKPDYVYKMGVLVTNHVSPGREAEFEKNSKEVMNVIRKTNAKAFLTSRLGLGGDPNTYTTLVLFDSFADMANFEPLFMKAMAEAKLSPEAGVVVHREYEVIRGIPELSIESPAQAAAK
jgi:hypothetical protein